MHERHSVSEKTKMRIARLTVHISSVLSNQLEQLMEFSTSALTIDNQAAKSDSGNEFLNWSRLTLTIMTTVYKTVVEDNRQRMNSYLSSCCNLCVHVLRCQGHSQDLTDETVALLADTIAEKLGNESDITNKDSTIDAFIANVVKEGMAKNVDVVMDCNAEAAAACVSNNELTADSLLVSSFKLTADSLLVSSFKLWLALLERLRLVIIAHSHDTLSADLLAISGIFCGDREKDFLTAEISDAISNSKKDSSIRRVKRAFVSLSRALLPHRVDVLSQYMIQVLVSADNTVKMNLSQMF